MAITQISRIQIRRGQQNVTGIPVLAPGEFGWAEDTNNLWIGQSMAEGAPSNSNVRILTQNDLNILPTYSATATIIASTTTVAITTFPFSGTQSSVNVQYNLYMPSIPTARTGTLLMNSAILSTITTATITDTYSYIGSSNGGLTFSVSLNTVTSTLTLGYSGTTSTGSITYTSTQFQ